MNSRLPDTPLPIAQTWDSPWAGGMSKASGAGAVSDERQITIIRDTRSFDAFQPEWQRFLASEVQGSSFNNEPVNVRFLLESAGNTLPFVIVVSRHGETQCVAPFQVVRRPFKLGVGGFHIAPVTVRRLELFGDDFIYGKNCVPRECVPLIFAALRRSQRHFDLVSLCYPDASSALWQYCVNLLSTRRGRPPVGTLSTIQRVHQVRLCSTHESYLASLNSNTRQALRRNTRRLLKDGRGRLVKVTRPEQVSEFLDQFDRVFQRTWQAKTLGYYPRNSAHAKRRFESIASRGWLRSYVLERDGSPVAFEQGFQYRNTFYCTECGFDPAWAEYGPGMVLMHLILEDLFKEDRPSLLDFGFGDAAYKRSFANAGYDAGYIELAVSDFGRHLLVLQRALESSSTYARTALAKLGLDGIVSRLAARKRWSKG